VIQWGSISPLNGLNSIVSTLVTLQRQEASGGGGADIGRECAVAVGVLGRALGDAKLTYHCPPWGLGLELGGMLPQSLSRDLSVAGAVRGGIRGALFRRVARAPY
jgi:hypothetical protein